MAQLRHYVHLNFIALLIFPILHADVYGSSSKRLYNTNVQWKLLNKSILYVPLTMYAQKGNEYEKGFINHRRVMILARNVSPPDRLDFMPFLLASRVAEMIRPTMSPDIFPNPLPRNLRRLRTLVF